MCVYEHGSVNCKLDFEVFICNRDQSGHKGTVRQQKQVELSVAGRARLLTLWPSFPSWQVRGVGSRFMEQHLLRSQWTQCHWCGETSAEGKGNRSMAEAPWEGSQRRKNARIQKHNQLKWEEIEKVSQANKLKMGKTTKQQQKIITWKRERRFTISLSKEQSEKWKVREKRSKLLYCQS